MSVITFDKGGVWSRIRPPSVDSEGKEFPCTPVHGRDTCSLHLTQKLSQVGIQVDIQSQMNSDVKPLSIQSGLRALLVGMLNCFCAQQ